MTAQQYQEQTPLLALADVDTMPTPMLQASQVVARELETASAIALSHTQISLETQERLYQAFLTPSAIWQAEPDLLSPYFLKRPALERFLALRQQINPLQLLDEYATAGITVLTIQDVAYPERLKVIHHAPKVLYIRGNGHALSRDRGLSIVGTRRMTNYGEQVTRHLVRGLKPYEPAIVSGLAAGVDTLAHQTALDVGLPTVAVFGTGLDVIFPKSNLRLAQAILDDGGALVSELPLQTLPMKHNFPHRNRIIAGLTMGTLVVEAPERSGALITSRVALEEGRNVMTVPGNAFSPNSQGCHQLLQQGAPLVTNAEDIAHVMGWEAITTPVLPASVTPEPSAEAVQAEAGLSAEVLRVLSCVDYEPMTREQILEKCYPLSLTDIQQALTMLEILGKINALPGNQFNRRV